MPRPPQVLFVVNVDYYFLSHRLPLAKALQRLGYDVTVACADTGLRDRFEEEGIRLFDLGY